MKDKVTAAIAAIVFLLLSFGVYFAVTVIPVEGFSATDTEVFHQVHANKKKADWGGTTTTAAAAGWSR